MREGGLLLFFPRAPTSFIDRETLEYPHADRYTDGCHTGPVACGTAIERRRTAAAGDLSGDVAGNGRVRGAIAAHETIGIFGDYDCDGITATALLVRFFRRHGVEPVVRLPHRVHDGYGLSRSMVEECAARGITLLLTVDTGITAVQEIAAAAELGIDVIVTDHHHVPAEVPQALALIHPALAPDHPLPHPSGVGVALQFVRALDGTDAWKDHQTDLALAAIGTIADLVELRGMNRTLVQQGIAALNTLQEGPLALLAASVRTHGAPLTSTDIAFRLSPRINAAGRMEDPHIALTALLEGGEALATLERLNAHRQDATGSLIIRAWELLHLLHNRAQNYPHSHCWQWRMRNAESIIGLIATI